MYKEKIDFYRDEVVATLRELVSFESVQGKATPECPFGKGVADAFDYMLKRAEADGFDVVNVDNYGGHIEWRGEDTTETLGIPVHLDVVPAGDGWSVEPFGGEIIDGKIYGRGTTDNKGAVCATYYAMRALKESGFSPKKNIRLILGLDEETGWIGMEKYLEQIAPPDSGFSPDADFPVINGEMGMMIFEMAKKLDNSKIKGLQLRNIEGGNAPNMVPDFARAVVFEENAKSYEKLKSSIEDFRKRTGRQLYGKGRGKAFEISVKGVSAHGAHPELGLNAISILMEFLSELNFANDSVRDYIDFYRHYLDYEIDGKSLGIAMKDSVSGNLICNVGMVSMNKDAAILTINVRYPVTKNEEDVYSALRPLIDKHSFGIVKIKGIDPLYFAPETPFIETLMSVYKENTGELDAKPIVIGGATYARAIPNAVAFGPRFPNEEDCMHQKDEFVSIDSLMKATHIFADAIYKLTE